MKKALVFFTFLIIVLLSACTGDKGNFDYSDFADQTVSSFNAIETQDDNRYVAYFYGKYCGHCKDIKNDILSFFDTFTLLPFYILETSGAPDDSEYQEYEGTPTLMVIVDGEPSEIYTGSIKVLEFIEKYSKLQDGELDYDYFQDQHITTYDEALEIDSEAYIIYYYLEHCPFCIRTKPEFLKWAITRGEEEIYFMNGALVDNPDQKPTELIVLNSGTPILVIMKNGEFANEFYSGEEAVLGYINETKDQPITTDNYTE